MLAAVATATAVKAAVGWQVPPHGCRPMIFASELAAFIGRNKYENPAVAAAKVWQRVHPASYHEAAQRANIVLRTDEDVVRDMGLGLQAAVEAVGEQEASAQVAAVLERPLFPACPPTLVKDVADVLAQGNASLPDRVSRVVQAVSRAAGGPLTSAASTTLRTAATRIVQQAMSTAAAAAAAAAAPAAADPAHAQVQAQIQAQVQVQAQVQAMACAVRVRDRMDAVASVQASVNKARGVAREPEALDLFERQTGASVRDRNDRFYVGNMGTSVQPCWLGGRVDGVHGDRVVEVKCRRNRFFSFLPEYERVQIHAYMHLTGKRECELVQKFNGQIHTTVHAFDRDYWSGVCEEARTRWEHLTHVFADEQRQDRLLRQCVA